MPRVTKLDLQNTVEELKKQLDEQKEHYLTLLNENDEKYNKLVNEREGQFHLLPEYQQMKKEIERLEIIKKSNEDTIKRKEEKEKKLSNKIQELLEENKQLKESIKNQTTVEVKHNARGAGRKPKSEEKIRIQLNQMNELLSHGAGVKNICEQMNISQATYYRLKKTLSLSKINF